jgi:hypothetical protein
MSPNNPQLSAILITKSADVSYELTQTMLGEENCNAQVSGS